MPERHRIYINARFLTQPITGVQRYGRELVRAIDQLLIQDDEITRDLDIRLLTPDCQIDTPLPLQRLRVDPIGKSAGYRWEQLELPKHVRGGLLFCPGNTAPMTTLLGKTPTVVVVHDLSYLYFPKAYAPAFRAAYHLLTPVIMRRATKIITVSQSEKSAIEQHFPRAGSRLFAIQNGGFADSILSGIKDHAAAPPPKPCFVYIGALSRRKNPQGILQAFSKIATPGSRLIMVGSSGKSFQNSHFSLPESISGQVEFTGQINDISQLIEIYRKATALIFPSFYEASPLPPVEAMACGCPVLASSIPSLQERCADAALFCDPHSVDDIAEKMQLLISDRDLWQNLQQKGLERAQRFTWERCARATLKIIKNALD